ncbi:MAG: YebC/PmpR family DNA-binding transcriptional regulator [Methylophilaceae bacterium]|nr:YebC/PmpR family DNA-binding transcriptional regulator [Methylophilaceae bacterium]
MAGHSKWANIQHRKGRQDAKRGKVFTKLIKEITVASRLGGGDVGTNPRLRAAVVAARDENMPADNINRAVKKGIGELEGVNYEEVRYEGYGIGGTAVLVDCLTDNKQRAVADVRHAFTKHGGNLGTHGCVAFMFSHCGSLVYPPGTPEDLVIEVALEAGADDVLSADDGSIEVTTGAQQFLMVKESMEAVGLKAVLGELTMKASTEVVLGGEAAEKMRKLIDTLDDLDDVQHLYTSAVFEY